MDSFFQYQASSCHLGISNLPLGQALGNAIYISDKYYQNRNYSQRNAKMSLEYAPSNDLEEPIDIEFSGIKIESEVKVRFAID